MTNKPHARNVASASRRAKDHVAQENRPGLEGRARRVVAVVHGANGRVSVSVPGDGPATSLGGLRPTSTQQHARYTHRKPTAAKKIPAVGSVSGL